MPGILLGFSPKGSGFLSPGNFPDTLLSPPKESQDFFPIPLKFKTMWCDKPAKNKLMDVC